MDTVAVLSDTEEKARVEKEEFDWSFDLCIASQRLRRFRFRLYLSEPLDEAEITGQSAELGAVGIRPEGSLMLVEISNGPAARPDLQELLDGMTCSFVIIIPKTHIST